MPQILDEIIEKTAQISDEEKSKLICVLQRQIDLNDKVIAQQEEQIKLRQKQIGLPDEKIDLNTKKRETGYVSPNTIWVKEHHAEYAGNYVALKDGELVAYGRTIKEADTKAKAKGIKNPLLHYIPAVDEEVWGGW